MPSTGSSKLDEIIAHKRSEIEKIVPLTEKLRASAAMREDFRSFFTALGGGLRDQERGVGFGENPLAVIAEVKRRRHPPGPFLRISTRSRWPGPMPRPAPMPSPC